MSAAGEKPFRFGVNMYVPVSRVDWVEKCRRAETAGFDVIGVADHLGMPPTFPALVLAAEATERVRLTTFVLNTAFYNPVLLAREAAGTDQFTDGRLELGLGAGYVKAEFETAGIPWEGAKSRVDHLENTVRELKRLFADPEHQPRPAQKPGPPLMLAGRGDRLLTLAAEHADIIGFTGAAPGKDGQQATMADAEGILERVEFVRGLLGARVSEVELNILVHQLVVTDDRQAALAEIQAKMPYLTVEQVGELPVALVGTHQEIADQLVAHRKRFGFSYFIVMEDRLDDFAPVIDLLR
ncbi:LLM class F420-dependent oxidoreductase [Amycolatopsis sp.]|uniref:LLM class F420-dependent oxidoreductase n=1 Tax=Amycolatopsis sp. TaxID=37632 RepID=UPI002E07B901|nr:LLM class F420-dependent oxidoreductase [Amycolatopsis sp.]